MEYRDRLNRIFVDVEDTAENREFFMQLKASLKAQFEQLDLWITAHPIDIL